MSLPTRFVREVSHKAQIMRFVRLDLLSAEGQDFKTRYTAGEIGRIGFEPVCLSKGLEALRGIPFNEGDLAGAAIGNVMRLKFWIEHLVDNWIEHLVDKASARFRNRAFNPFHIEIIVIGVFRINPGHRQRVCFVCVESECDVVFDLIGINP